MFKLLRKATDKRLMRIAIRQYKTEVALLDKLK